MKTRANPNRKMHWYNRAACGIQLQRPQQRERPRNERDKGDSQIAALRHEIRGRVASQHMLWPTGTKKPDSNRRNYA